jgi:hypothetical protein
MASTEDPLYIKKSLDIWEQCWGNDELREIILYTQEALIKEFTDRVELGLHAIIAADEICKQYDLPTAYIGTVITFIFLDKKFDPSDRQSVRERMISPVSALSFKNKVRISSDGFGGGNKPYDALMSLTGHDLSADQFQKLMDNFFGDSLVITVAPFTKKTELLDFINKHWKTDMEPTLRYDSKTFLSNPGKLRERHTSKKSYTQAQLIDEIMSLHGEGCPAPKITKWLNDNGYDYIEPSNIRKIISRQNRLN